MSSTLTHAASASWIAVTSAHIHPVQTSYIAAALISASVLDVDHLVFMIRDTYIVVLIARAWGIEI